MLIRHKAYQLFAGIIKLQTDSLLFCAMAIGFIMLLNAQYSKRLRAHGMKAASAG